jgi:exodeoxyribonuclease V alpha subunit
LASTLPNVGVNRARALVARFGSELWSVIESRPHVLAEVDGITPDRVTAIVEAYAAHRADRDSMVRLRGWGLTDNQIARCREVWPTVAEVVEHVHANPYVLCDHVPGFGFLRADRVALRAGIAHDAPARVLAGIDHTLEVAVGGGDCFLWGAELQRRAVKLLGVDGAVVATGIRTAIAGGRIAGHRARYYPRRIDDAEAACAGNLATMIQIARAHPPPAPADVIDLATRRRARQSQGT